MRVFGRGWSAMVLGLALLGLGCKNAGEAPNSLSYGVNPAIYTTGTAITPNSPTHGGGTVDSYAVSPALPAGLSLDTASGVITGTPTLATAATTYTVTATNTAGSATASLSITVNDPAIALSITAQPVSQSILVGQTATFSVTATGTGTLSYQWMNGGIAIPGATSASYTTPVAVLADNGSTFTVKVSDSNGSVTSTAATLTVLTQGGPGAFAATGSMGASRTFHTATLLTNGKVLVAGGFDSANTLGSAELYDPTAGTFTATGSLLTPRQGHAATLLANGTVLITGGTNLGAAVATAEIYNPANGKFTATAGSLKEARYDHTATLLQSGKVLVAGGRAPGGLYAATAELYDPVLDTFTTTANAPAIRYTHTATRLQNGKVLIAGGYKGSALLTAELYDPASGATGTFAPTGAMSVARNAHTATLLPSGKVLMVGGAADATCELYDPTAGTFSPTTGKLLTIRASYHTAALLPTGKVLIAGGLGSGSPAPILSAAELYDPAAGTFAGTGNMLVGRELHTATTLGTGKVLHVGGQTFGYTATAELYY